MELDRAILVDAQGNFLGAFQWDASKPKPRFQLPRRGEKTIRDEDRKYELPASVAVPGMEQMRWDFRAKQWIAPTEKIYLVDERGNLRGSARHFPDQAPNVPIGWTTTKKARPRSRTSKAYFDGTDWVFPVRRARVEGDVLTNFELVKLGEEPEGVEYVEPPLLGDGAPAPIGARRVNGSWEVSLD